MISNNNKINKHPVTEISHTNRRKNCNWKLWTAITAIAGLALGMLSRSIINPPLDHWCPSHPPALKTLCPISEFSNISQSDIDQLNWSQPLLVDPPRPSSRAIDCSTAEEWVGSHVGLQGQVLARELIKNIDHITQNQFEEALRCTTAEFNHHLKEAGDTNYIVWGPGGITKSELWVASLALKHLKFLPEDVVAGELSLNKYPTVRQIAIFDDAAYSGQQMGESISIAMKVLKKNFPDGNFKVHVVLPYISEYGITKVSGIPYEFKDNLKLYHSQIFTPIQDLLPGIIAENFYAAYHPRTDGPPPSTKSLVMFDHKIPDATSNFVYPIKYGNVGYDIRSDLEKMMDNLMGQTYPCEGDRSTFRPECSFEFVSGSEKPPYRRDYLPAPRQP